MLIHWGMDEMRVLKNLGVKDVPSPIERNYKWPGRYTPMVHQKVTSGFLTLHRRAFCFNDPGTAKTIAALWAADYLMQRGEIRRVLIVCPLSIMQSAWMGDINNSIIHRSAIIAHHAQASRRVEMIQGDYEFVIINYDGINLVADDIKADGRFDLIIVDECFVAGTRVSTPNGPRAIETLQAGEKINTSNGVMPIQCVIRNTTKRVVNVKTTCGRSITCTPEHPFFTDAGWVTAQNLSGRRLISSDGLRGMRGRVQETEKRGATVLETRDERRDDLLTILRTEEIPLSESGEVLFHQHAESAARRSDRDRAVGGIQGEHVAFAESQRVSSETTRGQRDGHDSNGETGVRTPNNGMGMELPRSVGREAARLSHELQTRLRKPGAENRAGGRWEQPQPVRQESAGQQEGGEIGDAWVESVTHIECGRETPVYDLRIEGTPNYFVEDLLVHNCNAYALPSTRRWKSLAKIMRPDTFLWMMTGTPAAQSPVNAYGLAKLVNPNAVPSYMNAWRDKVMNKITTFKWAPKADARDKVFEVLQPAIRFTKEQCLDLPPVMKTTREVPLTPMQAKYYEKIKNDMLVVAAGQTISAVNKAAVVNKLLQISCGGVYSEDGDVVEFDAAPRMRLLLEILGETDRKVIIFAMFRSSIDSIVNYLRTNGVNTETIHGGVNATRRGEIINTFQNDNKRVSMMQDSSAASIRVLVMQPQATAHGITLTAADTVVFFGPLMSVELYTQAIARADRKGQDAEKVTVIHVQSSPIEKKMFAAMDSKVSEHALLTQMFDEEIGMK